LFIEKKAEDEFMTKLVESSKKIRLGDPLDPKTRLGAIVSEKQMQTVLGYIEAGKNEGAKLLAGGKRAQVNGDHGYFIEPTIFGSVNNDMKIAQEEIFGPVLATPVESRHSVDQYLWRNGRINALWRLQAVRLWA
jgi:acyl-CoA reductase-like NAD-dependent aldehyde dehydrogenase